MPASQALAAQAIAQLRGDGRSQRAAGAMCIQWQAGVDEFFVADAVEVAVDYAVAFLQVATFQQYGAGTEIEQG